MASTDAETSSATGLWGWLRARLGGRASRAPSAVGQRPAPVPNGVTTPWDADVLGRVRRLHLRARVTTDALLMGSHRSLRTGQAIEFADYQEYSPGMDLRGVDWRAWGRTDRLMVKRFQTETELACTVVLDLSGDVATGDAGKGGMPPLEGTKAGVAITAAATLLYWFSRQGEPVGLRLVAGSAPFRDLPPRRGRSQLQQCFLALGAARPEGKADLSRVLAEVGGRVRRRSMVVVISDAMEDPAVWMPSLAAFARRGSDLRFLHVFDRAELRLEQDHASLFYSPEGGDAIAVDPSGAAKEFAQVVAEWMAEVRAGVVKFGGQYVAVPTDRPLEEVIRSVVHGRVEPVELP